MIKIVGTGNEIMFGFVHLQLNLDDHFFAVEGIDQNILVPHLESIFYPYNFYPVRILFTNSDNFSI